MYHVINKYADLILESIHPNHIVEYDWLLANINQISNNDYRRKYKYFWKLNSARLSDSFCKHYFELLEEAITRNININEVTERLFYKQSHTDRNSIQFSFASKLLHMTDPKQPIYDSMISSFYFYSEPKSTKPTQERIVELSLFHTFLMEEYCRIIADGLLEPAIAKFRVKHQPKTFTDHKIVDSLLWAFVSLQNRDGFRTKNMLYC